MKSILITVCCFFIPLSCSSLRSDRATSYSSTDLCSDRVPKIEVDAYGNSQIHKAALLGLPKTLERLLTQGIEDLDSDEGREELLRRVGIRNACGVQPLHFAAQGGNVACVELLIKKFGADISAVTLQNALVKQETRAKRLARASEFPLFSATPLHYAAYYGRTAVIEYLVSISKKECTKIAQHYNPELDTNELLCPYQVMALQLMPFTENSLLRRYLAGTFSVAKVRSIMTEALHTIKRRSWSKLYKEIRAEYYDTDLENSEKPYRNEDIVNTVIIDSSALTKGNNVRSKLSENLIAIVRAYYVMRIPDHDYLDSLIEEEKESYLQKALSFISRSATGATTFHEAAKQGDCDRLKFLLLRGIDVNMRDDEGYTALYYALSARHYSSVKLLLDSGALVTAQGCPEPLHLCCSKNNFYALELLLDKGAMVDQKNSAGMSPLHIACQEGNFECVKRLLASGADTNMKDRVGKTPSDYARAVSSEYRRDKCLLSLFQDKLSQKS